ncbi:hypothetical protein Nocox_40155 [Nonomuraea coxensis DSM 45129]|uniref:Double-GTPase 2 domain-containing protein n=1 Tax=Nonomuraea coxensis DSM 45129 TaxID=1122611 RepID=A0ABX8UCS0_9ACTN|nr:GTPase domain-containing protein [Nonomuraea coxensis]QYC45574.1 hypothetical protein Nocox_40155 [Nonomuraea coxensis DSM 45129]
MNIVMLGHPNAGKTTYMSSMYKLMAADGFYGFRVRAKSNADHYQLMSAADRIGRGEYPAPSDRHSDYELTFRHGASELLDFLWRDYRGGALLDRSTSEDTRRLLDDLEAADAIVLFIDFVDLQRGRAAREKVRRLTTLLFQALSGRDRLTPIVVVLTKADLADPDRDDGIEVLYPLLEAVSDNRLVVCLPIGVACGPRPQNVEVPVLFCLCFGLMSQVYFLGALMQQSAATGDRYSRGDTWWNRVRSGWNGELSNRELASLAYQKAYVEQQALLTLLGPAQALESFLAENFVLLGGGVNS